MNRNIQRQLKDIQLRAEHLLNGRPTLEEIEEFDQYNEELKNFLLSNLAEPELLERVRQIPKILEESPAQLASRGLVSTVLAFFASSLIAYFQERQQIENAIELIREVRGAYATIEFFTRNS
ncbi:MAG TPA: hypothetical protein VGD40_08720 [Chryseosolibacter sp.]